MLPVVVLSLLTVLSLVAGVVLASVGGSFYVKYRNKLMLARVALQAACVISPRCSSGNGSSVDPLRTKIIGGVECNPRFV